MKDIKLLDCTLRDGGYLNDWEFGYSNLISTFERLVNTNAEIIEIGFLDEEEILILIEVLCQILNQQEKFMGKSIRKMRSLSA